MGGWLTMNDYGPPQAAVPKPDSYRWAVELWGWPETLFTVISQAPHKCSHPGTNSMAITPAITQHALSASHSTDADAYACA